MTDAAARYGGEFFYSADREMQAFLIAGLQIRRAIDVMTEYDKRPKSYR